MIKISVYIDQLSKNVYSELCLNEMLVKRFAIYVVRKVVLAFFSLNVDIFVALDYCTASSDEGIYDVVGDDKFETFNNIRT